ncbi:MAG: PorP/SprF family type IX secretion system membrane protein [Bacteroidia bacterium]|nr:PorP/SprF family type IX secretion system membrane protein [Bacteroidia bacterium]
MKRSSVVTKAVKVMRTMNVMKIFIVLAFALCVSSIGYAQDQAVYNEYIKTQGILNPGYNGARGSMSGLMVFRSQWTGFEGAPYTVGLNFASPLDNFSRKLKKIGAGIVIQNDHEGLTNNLEFSVAGSYRVVDERRLKLQLGLSLGVNNKRINGAEAITSDYGDPMFTGNISKFGFNFGFGGFLWSEKNDNNFFAGIAIPKFFATKYDTNTQQIKHTVSMKDLHTYIYGGYLFEVSNNGTLLRPTALMRVVPGAPMQFDISGSVFLMDKLWLGLTYRTVSEAVLFAEYQITKMFSVHYSFDYSISPIREYAKFGSHEFSIKYDFVAGKGKSKPGTRSKSIRYF